MTVKGCAAGAHRRSGHSRHDAPVLASIVEIQAAQVEEEVPHVGAPEALVHGGDEVEHLQPGRERVGGAQWMGEGASGGSTVDCVGGD